MTKPDGIPKDASAASPWGTWEDLLLAFAVNRHGTHAWDSIASELHKRINVSLTPVNCRNMYLDLRRRFLHDDAKSDAQISAPLLDELRKLRVAELRREVQRYDLNIESLELKMKKMEEEREGSLGRENNEADLNKDEEKTVAAPATTGEPVFGDELDKDQLSVNESNSTDLDAEKLRTGQKEPEPDRRAGDEAEHDQTGGTSEEPSELKFEPDQKSAREDSCNGSSNSIEKSERKAKAEPNSSEQGGLVDSEAESDGGGEAATKENSDVQSSASRSRKEEGSDKVRRGNTSGDEREHEDQSRAVKQLSTESQPLVGFLQAIKAHKFGSVFQRRLRSQESSKYQKVILQHVDLGIIETRMTEGLYSGSTVKFFRDLLLLVNNALVFFGKNSAEANAATEIRWLISKEISQKQAKSDSSSGKHASLQSLSLTKKEEPEPSRPIMLKPMLVCRKRSSIAAKASSTSSDKKKEQADDKDAKPQHSQSNSEEPKITKKRTRDSFPSVPTNTKKNGKNQYSTKNAASELGKQQPGKGGSASTSISAPQQTENKKNQTSSESKKRGAANFLNRMKQGGSSSNNSVLLDALKNTPLTSESSSGKGGSEQKKTESNTKRGEKKEALSKKSKEKSSPAKRNVGRPPKRGAAPPLAIGKRNREGDQMETPPAKQPKKRSRKL